MLAVRIDSVKNPPWGIDGGMAGGSGRVVVNPGTNHERALAPLSDGNVLRHGACSASRPAAVAATAIPSIVRPSMWPRTWRAAS